MLDPGGKMPGVAEIEYQAPFCRGTDILVGLFRLAEIQRDAGKSSEILQANIEGNQSIVERGVSDAQRIRGRRCKRSGDVLVRKRLVEQILANEFLQGIVAAERK